MLAFSFACVPLYSLFCKVTGYAGTVKRVQSFDDQVIGKRYIKVRFNADVDPELNWVFRPHIKDTIVKTGQNSLIFYDVQNLNNFDTDGIAIYNVTPHKAAKYFNKIACFCFERQTISANQKVVMPVSFFIDSAIENDKQMDDIKVLTLSYTFLPYHKYKW
jgi:cytochrome c oxidase assembly protein subunit 11